MGGFYWINFPHCYLPILLLCSLLLNCPYKPQRLAAGNMRQYARISCLFFLLVVTWVLVTRSWTPSYGNGKEFVQLCCFYCLFVVFFVFVFVFVFEKLEELNLYIHPWLSFFFFPLRYWHIKKLRNRNDNEHHHSKQLTSTHIFKFKMNIQQEPTLTAQGNLLNVIWQPGWDGNLGENGYMYTYCWVSLLSTLN